MLSEIINTISDAGTKDHDILKAKLSRINTGLSTGVHGIVFDNEKYTTLVQKTNNSKDSNIIKQRKLDIYGKVFGFRQRIDTILKVMRDQVKNDFSNVNTVSVSESIVNELRTMLSYLAIIQQSNTIIVYERGDVTINIPGTKIYDIVNNAVNAVKGGAADAKTTLRTDAANFTELDGIDIFGIPLEDDTYNTSDEKRYLYGITHFAKTKTT